MSKHTGWEILPYQDRRPDGHGERSWRIYQGHSLIAEGIRTESDARLIARAPDLAEENERLREINAELLAAINKILTDDGLKPDTIGKLYLLADKAEEKP